MTRGFSATVTSKLHYAVYGLTAAELIVSQVDSEKTNLGLTTDSGEHVWQADVTIAKIYNEK